MDGIYILLAIIVFIIIVIISNIKIVPQAYVYVVERLGAFHAAWEQAFKNAQTQT